MIHTSRNFKRKLKTKKHFLVTQTTVISSTEICSSATV